MLLLLLLLLISNLVNLFFWFQAPVLPNFGAAAHNDADGMMDGTNESKSPLS